MNAKSIDLQHITLRVDVGTMAAAEVTPPMCEEWDGVKLVHQHNFNLPPMSTPLQILGHTGYSTENSVSL